MMRIITGKARGTRLYTLPTDDTRPTTEMAKEGIFSAVQFELVGAEVLDLFSGTGQLALEALSRGAKSAVCVENSRKAAEIIRKNAAATKLEADLHLVVSDAFAYLKNTTARFNLIFADPPYGQGLAEKVVEKVLEYDVLKPGGALLVEAEGEESVPRHLWEKFAFSKSYHYGKTYVLLLRKGEEENA
ncbi:MAG: 16S rRNA (guanine(966)-N(2))-methyltransferase RsmD [Clostridia bacterium]|nr:16S rRNA (guanine(966)-N(2))-methyltransferase RsmD [Clostridia bacterium]